MKRVEGKVAIIVGGAMGMGFGSAMALAMEGAKAVIIVDYSEEGSLAAEKINSMGGHAEFHQADVRDGAKLKTIFQTVVDKYGSLDILVNSAGLGSQHTFLDMDEEWMDTYMDVNFKGIWHSCKAAIPHMLKQNYGKIVNFSSVTGVLVVDPGMTAYAATKGAIMAFTKALASEYATNNITVNAILPGLVDTPMANRECSTACPDNPQKVKDAMSKIVPMGRMGTIEEAGKVCLFLASDDSSYVTGTSIVFDGGSTLPETPGTGWEPQQ